MNKFVFSFLLFLFSLNLANVVVAQDAPRLAFGSVYYTKGASVTPGSNFSYDIYFFVDSEYGDRTAHISVSVNSPDGWKTYVLPELTNRTFNISGTLATSEENIYVEPRPKLQSIPDPKEEGIYYIASPSGRGYLQAKKVTIYVNVPENAEVGKTYLISASAVAKYFGDLGSLSFSQARNFDFNVLIKPPVYTEQVITETQQPNQTRNESENTSQQSESNVSNEGSIELNNSITTNEAKQGNEILSYIIVAVVSAAVVYILVKYGSGKKKPYKNYKVRSDEESDKE
ncbi:MAG: hypothetical protein QXT72_03075 [Candidatus Micrarchaeia archaeon]